MASSDNQPSLRPPSHCDVAPPGGEDQEDSPQLPLDNPRISSPPASNSDHGPPDLWRDRLIAAMGLRFDPFRTSFSDDDILDFEEIYVDLPPEQNSDSPEAAPLLSLLQEPRHTFVFADYGMGKTMTWRALEYQLRIAREDRPTLVVRYTPRLPVDPANLSEDTDLYLHALAEEMVIDLLVQALERIHDRFPRSEPLSPELEQLLRRLYSAAPGLLRRAIRELAAGQAGEGTSWGGLRPNILLRDIDQRWRAWLRGLIADLPRQAGPPMAWPEIRQAAEELGFPTIFLLVDAVDERSIEIQRQMSVLASILDLLTPFEQTEIFVKGFLPLELEETLKSKLQDCSQSLTAIPELATIARRTPEHLQQIIDQRLSAASAGSTSFRNLDWFRSREIGESIQDRLVELADGSPRRLIQLVSLLLDDHSSHGYRINQQIELSGADWQHFLAKVTAHRPPAPPPA